MKFKTYTLQNYKEMPQISQLAKKDIASIDVVSHVLPFKTNNYVVDELIDWKNYENDPIYKINFPQKDMLIPEHFKEMESVINSNTTKSEIRETANNIRLQLNPHPAGQLEHNVPEINGERLLGIQHKYNETMLFFPTQGQTCHAYCTFCFRWPQFVGMDELKFAMKQGELMVEYLKEHDEVTDVLFTGGDPMTMKTKHLESYINILLDADLPHLRNIRIGTKALTFWPQRYVDDNDTDNLLRLFEKVSKSKKNLAIMAHFNHPRELETDILHTAVNNIRNTGALIRTQSPLLNNINAEPELWSAMWNKQVELGMIPYYMFVARNTGAQHYFSVPLVKAWQIFRKAYSKVGGICRTVRGPSMSADPGKVLVAGVSKVNGTKVINLTFIQGRNSKWVRRPFFAKYDEKATWLNDLVPAFDEKEFFYEDEFKRMYN